MEYDILKDEQYREFLTKFVGGVDLKNITPMMRQYLEIKLQAQDCIIFYRLGDFYEMFFEDAKVASSELNLVLTGRDCGLEQRAAMCGIPFVSYESYLPRLVLKGYKVAICEQVSPVGKGLVKREIVRIVSQGTSLDNSILQEDSANYLCCVYGVESGLIVNHNNSQLSFGVAWADVSTGHFNMRVCSDESKLQDLLSMIRPREIICNGLVFVPSFEFSIVKAGDCPRFSKFHDWAFELSAANEIAKQQLNVELYDKVKNNSLALCALGALIECIAQMHKSAVNLTTIEEQDSKSKMTLNQYTIRTLELVSNMRDGSKQGTLNKVINLAITDMGKRKLKKWILSPLLNCKAINDRLDIVQCLSESLSASDGLVSCLKQVKDIERLGIRIQHRLIRPQDLVVLGQSLMHLPQILSILGNLDQGKGVAKLTQLQSAILSNSQLCQLLNTSLAEAPAVRPQDGAVFAIGYDKKLDEYRKAKLDSSELIVKIESVERQTTGIKRLKIGFNKINGYFIEVPSAQRGLVPYSYLKKQSMSNTERYTTKELIEIENNLEDIEEKVVNLETMLYEQFLDKLIEFVPSLLSTADSLADLDCYLAFANCATMYDYTRPEIVEGGNVFSIEEGRHPVVERLTEKFVPNDAHLDSQNRTMIITGPNMSGKSVYMRQVALIAILAQMGSFVPAKSCKLSPLSDIFARIGSGDDMLSGRSTFMVEMTELASILKDTPDNSLILLDELGRGTATFDGISIAKAVIEHLVCNTKAFTLFSTHYQELTDLDSLQYCHNFQMAVRDKAGRIVFDNKLIKGKASKSFGLKVAALSGIPKEIIDRAQSILSEIS